jgi:hypothetical protein
MEMLNSELREIDVQVASKIMGWRIKGKDSDWRWWGVPPGWTEPESVEIPCYSSDIAATWKVVERMRDIWTAWTEKLDANRGPAIDKIGKMSTEERMRYFDAVYEVSKEMAGPEPFSDEAFFNRLHRHADRRWPWAFFYADPKAICVAALAAFPELVKTS